MKFENLNPEYKYENALIIIFKKCGVEPEDEVTIIGDQFMITSKKNVWSDVSRNISSEWRYHVSRCSYFTEWRPV